MFFLNQGPQTKPIGLEWRSSSWLVTAVIGLGIAVDLLVYSIIIPVMPFQLVLLGYSNVSSLTGWLLFAYSGGLVISTIPIAMLSERYNARQLPLVFGLFVLMGSQVMLMEAPNYPVMCIARILQGIGSSMVWVVGLALLSDSSPPSMVGLQLGIAMMGLSLGMVVGPPVGGLLYSHFGFRGPFIFGISATFLDLIGRLILIERKDALVWGIDPAKISSNEDNAPSPVTETKAEEEIQEIPSASTDVEAAKDQQTTVSQEPPPATDTEAKPEIKISLVSVMADLSRSPRALVALFIIFVYGIVYSSQEPAIPLHLQRVWDLDSRAVGIVFIAAVVPTMFSAPLTGFWADKKGTEWPATFSLLFSIPWWVIIIIEYRLALFVAAFALEAFFTSGVMSPLTAELAAVSRDLDGVGYGHIYGAFNLVYGVGTSIGPIVGGQMYDHIQRGWMALCLLAAGLLIICLGLALFFVGSNPFYYRLRGLSLVKKSES
ncbi:hypothetical protein NLJ89_g7065 [Agrocybe chaxingu]|uniref:Major facilitator superfamily (MFS) profile domain-containing protein n=1 Tax=Agrocybe chaxingu TaxID=84603 RepID=A0A9W8JY04_9AGAR|nr:hypothetical protein NLJ89_g7065 [Agrocybe chaxingu]